MVKCLVLVLILVSGCTNHISRSEYDSFVKAQREYNSTIAQAVDKLINSKKGK